MKHLLPLLSLLLTTACSDPRPVEICEDYGRMSDGDLQLHQPFLPIEITCENSACFAAVDFWDGFVALGEDGYKIEYMDLPVEGRTWVHYANSDTSFYYAGEIQHVIIGIDQSLRGHFAESMVIAHEIGHALGLAHDTCRNSVMTAGELRELSTVEILPHDQELLNNDFH